MEYIVIPFSSRAHTIKFAEKLRAAGVANTIVSTPKEAGVGCGLAVKINPKFFATARSILNFSNLDSFAGFFRYTVSAGKFTVKKI